MTAKLLPLLPSHKQYCEPYFGGGSVFFAKHPCGHETINDIDQGVTDFFRVLRDNGEWFIERANLTEYGEGLFRECRDTWRQEPDEKLRAWKWWVTASQGFSGLATVERNGVGYSHSHSRTEACQKGGNTAKWVHGVDRLPDVIRRLRSTQIFCGDALRAMRCCDTEDCLHYVDPPYVSATRSDGAYSCEMTDEAHGELVAYLLAEIRGKVVVSGYCHPLYVPLEEAGWVRIDFPTACHSTGRTVGSGLIGKGTALAKQARTESVWLCPRTVREVKPNLFNQGDPECLTATA